MKSSAKNIQISSYDDLFKTDAERLADTQERIQALPLDKLVPFPNHPFKVIDDEKMQETIDSIKEYGVLVPVLVRPKDDGSFEIVSGHRRHRASVLAVKLLYQQLYARWTMMPPFWSWWTAICREKPSCRLKRRLPIR